MKLVVGLGNPGPAYAGTRHNLGAAAVRRLAGSLGFPRFRRERHGLVSRGWVQPAVEQADPRPAVDLVLLLPRTFMNASGLAVRALLGARSWTPPDLVVVHDDLDLPSGRLKVRLGGSAGGHLGVQSVIEALGTDRFVRVKIGIGRPPEDIDPVGFVLGRPAGAEREALASAAARAAEAALAVVREGIQPAMARFNRAVKGPAPEETAGGGKAR